MTLGFRLFLIFLILNLIVTIIYGVISIFFKNVERRKVFIRVLIMLLAPGAGALLFFVSWVFYRFFFNEEVDLSDVVFSKERERELVRTDEERDRNVVSIEEAIEVTEKSDLRKLLMSVAQGNYENSLSAISMALNCEDTETAHYAASVLQEALSEFRLKVQKDYEHLAKKAQSEDDIEEEAAELIEYMDKYLVQHVFGEAEQKSHVDMLANVAELMFTKKPEAVTSKIFETVCSRLLEIKDYERCENFAKRAKEYYPNTLSSYTSLLKLYFNSEKKEQFFAELENLKRSSVIIDKETLQLVRTFM